MPTPESLPQDKTETDEALARQADDLPELELRQPDAEELDVDSDLSSEPQDDVSDSEQSTATPEASQVFNSSNAVPVRGEDHTVHIRKEGRRASAPAGPPPLRPVETSPEPAQQKSSPESTPSAQKPPTPPENQPSRVQEAVREADGSTTFEDDLTFAKLGLRLEPSRETAEDMHELLRRVRRDGNGGLVGPDGKPVDPDLYEAAHGLVSEYEDRQFNTSPDSAPSPEDSPEPDIHQNPETRRLSRLAEQQRGARSAQTTGRPSARPSRFTVLLDDEQGNDPSYMPEFDVFSDPTNDFEDLGRLLQVSGPRYVYKLRYELSDQGITDRSEQNSRIDEIMTQNKINFLRALRGVRYDVQTGSYVMRDGSSFDDRIQLQGIKVRMQTVGTELVKKGKIKSADFERLQESFEEQTKERRSHNPFRRHKSHTSEARGARRQDNSLAESQNRPERRSLFNQSPDNEDDEEAAQTEKLSEIEPGDSRTVAARKKIREAFEDHSVQIASFTAVLASIIGDVSKDPAFRRALEEARSKGGEPAAKRLKIVAKAAGGSAVRSVTNTIDSQYLSGQRSKNT